MPLWAEFRNRIGYLFGRAQFGRELDEEIRFHIENRAGELELEGRAPCRAGIRLGPPHPRGQPPRVAIPLTRRGPALRAASVVQRTRLHGCGGTLARAGNRSEYDGVDPGNKLAQ